MAEVVIHEQADMLAHLTVQHTLIGRINVVQKHDLELNKILEELNKICKLVFIFTGFSNFSIKTF